MELCTDRLLLRQWRPDDQEAFRALNADPEVMEFFPSVLDAEASDALQERLRSGIEERGFGFWATELRSTGELLGFVGLNRPNYELPFGPCVEIGWRLARAHWGRGYASEAAAESLRAGFQELGLGEIVSFTARVNERSWALMGRLGMRPDPLTFLHPAVPADSILAEHRLFRLRAEDWAARQSSGS